MLKDAETYQGNRIGDIIREYAPSSSSIAEVQAIGSNTAYAGRDGNKLCMLTPTHTNHTVSECNTRKRMARAAAQGGNNKATERGTGASSRLTPGSIDKICWQYKRGGKCRFGDNCAFKHLPNASTNTVGTEPSFDKDDVRYANSCVAGTAKPNGDPFAYISTNNSSEDDPDFQ